jgi:hypothetical protein
MDTDAPHPHCPFCGLAMQFKRTDPRTVTSTLAAFDCNWCGVVLKVSPLAEVLELAAPALAPV